MIVTDGVLIYLWIFTMDQLFLPIFIDDDDNDSGQRLWASSNECSHYTVNAIILYLEFFVLCLEI